MAASYATSDDCQSQKRRAKPSFFLQVSKLSGLLTVRTEAPISREPRIVRDYKHSQNTLWLRLHDSFDPVHRPLLYQALEHRFSNQDKVVDCSVVLVKILALDMKIMNNGGTAKVK